MNFFCRLLLMDNRSWNILCWNIRGINAMAKCDAVRNKIEESSCSIVCLPETKREHFDTAFIRNFAPRRFDHFDYIPLVGASGGILVLWCSSVFHGTIVEKNPFSITASFVSAHNDETWFLTNVYGPCDDPGRSAFIDWFKSCDVNDTTNWIFSGISISIALWITTTGLEAI